MKRKPSIKNRVRAVILLASVIVLLVTTAVFAIYEAVSFKNQLVQDLSTLAAVVADNGAYALAFDSKPTGEAILAALKANPDIVRAAFYNEKGRVFATFPAQLSPQLVPAQVGSEGPKFSNGMLIFFKSVVHENKAVGSLYLQSSLRGLYQRFWRYGTIVAAVLAGSLLMAFLLSTLLQKRISEPILALTQAATAVSQKADYSIRVPKLTDDELGTFTEAFNRMLAETQEHQSRLTEQARLLDLSNDAIIVRDALDRIVYWNRGAEELYGWTQAEALGKSKAAMLLTEFPEPRDRILARLNQESRWAGELVQTRRDGARIHVSTRWAIDRDAQGNLASVLITDNDITPRKQAEQALKESEERFRTLGDNISQLAWMADATGALFWYNRRWYEYTGTTFEEMQGWGWAKVQHPDHLEAVTAKWKAHLARGEAWEDTFPLRAHDGQYRWFLSRAFPIYDSQHRLLRWFGTNTDITEQKMFQEELERLVQERTAKLYETIGELEAFSYSISHDMRSPLRAMQGFSDALLEDYQDRLDPKGKDYLERIARAARRLDLLIQDVLAYSRIAKAEIDLRPVDLEKLIEEILPDHPEFQAPRATIVIDKPLHKVIGHEAYLTQCITNLVGNAVKFIPPGVQPQVRIRTEASEGKVRIWFEDNGIGITPAHFERIFQIFGQVYGGKQYAGTGIGLAIVRKASQRMGGSAGVESELGKGSRFWIVLNQADYDYAPRDPSG